MTTKADTEQERAEFEAWANGRCELHLVNPAGRYSSATTQFAWEAYQAGRAALKQNAKYVEGLLEGKQCRALSIVSNRILDEDRIGTEYYARQMISGEIARFVLDKHMVENRGEGHTTFYVDVYVLTHGEFQDAVAAIDHARRVEGADDA